MRKLSLKYKIAAILSLNIINTASAGGWYNDFTITELQFSRGTDGVHIVYSGGAGGTNFSTLGCDTSNAFILPYTSNIPEREKAMLSGVLTAYASGKKSRAYLEGCINGIGGVSYPAIWYFFSK